MATKKKPVEDIVEEQSSEPIEAPLEPQEVEEVVETGFDPSAPVEDVPPTHVFAGDGDSYASLAVRFAPEGVKARDFAKELFALNGGAVVRPGVKVKVSR